MIDRHVIMAARWNMVQASRRHAANARELVNLRMSPEDRSVIDRAARGSGKTRTEFIIEASRRAAHEALLDATLILVDTPAYDRLKAMLDQPPDPPVGLRRLMSLQAPWEP